MRAHRNVEFGTARWEEGSDTITCRIAVNVEGLEFEAQQPISRTAMATGVPGLGRQTTLKDWEVVAKDRIRKYAATCQLDTHTPSQTVTLPMIESYEVETVFFEAKIR